MSIKSLITVGIFELLFTYQERTSFISFHICPYIIQIGNLFSRKIECFSACSSQNHGSIMIKSLHVNEQRRTLSWAATKSKFIVSLPPSMVGYLTVFRYVWISFTRPNFVHLICVPISLHWFGRSFLSIGIFPQKEKRPENNMKNDQKGCYSTATIKIGEREKEHCPDWKLLPFLILWKGWKSNKLNENMNRISYAKLC